MTTYTWAGSSAPWSSANYWLVGGEPTGGVPGSLDVAVIDGSLAETITVGTVSVGSLTVTDTAATILVPFNGLLTVSSISNAGTVTVDNQLVITGDVTTANLGTIDGSGPVLIAGTLDNSDATLDIPFLEMTYTSLVIGGTLDLHGQAGGDSDGSLGEFQDVTVLGDLPVYGSLSIGGNLTLIPSEGGHSTITLTFLGEYPRAQLIFLDSETLDNVIINMASDPDPGEAPFFYFDPPPTIEAKADLTLGQNVTLTALGSSEVINGVDLTSFGTILSHGITTYHEYSTYGDSGTIEVQFPAQLTIEVQSFYNAGFMKVDDGALLSVQASVSIVNAGTIVADAATLQFSSNVSGSGQIFIGDGGAAELTGSYTGQTFNFTGSQDFLQLGFAHGTSDVFGFTPGDIISLVSTPATVAFADGTLDITSTGGRALAGFVIHDVPAGAVFSATIDTSDNTTITETIPCFLRGTHILTDRGDTRVELLRVGDRVRTATGQLRAVTWVGNGRQLVTGQEICAATPVVVRAGALGQVPHRDLRVTQGHCLLFQEDGRDVLVPAALLVNGRSIVVDEAPCIVEFYHFAIDGHDVVLAEGAAAETYLDDGAAFRFDVTPPTQAEALYAPKIGYGPEAIAIWRRLRELAGCGAPEDLTPDPDIHLLANGRRINPERTDLRTFRFALPSLPRELRLVSRSARPATIGLGPDIRRLGIGVSDITFSRGPVTVRLSFDDPTLAAGFHDADHAEARRWTNGDAMMPTAVLPRGILQGAAALYIDVRAVGLSGYPEVDERQVVAA